MVSYLPALRILINLINCISGLHSVYTLLIKDGCIFSKDHNGNKYLLLSCVILSKINILGDIVICHACIYFAE